MSGEMGMNLRERLEQDLLELAKKWQARADNWYKNGEPDDMSKLNPESATNIKAAVCYGCLAELNQLLAWREVNDAVDEEAKPRKSYFATPDGRQRFTGEAMTPGMESLPQAEQPAISREESLIQKAEAFGRWYEGQQTIPVKPIDLARSAWWAALDWLVKP